MRIPRPRYVVGAALLAAASSAAVIAPGLVSSAQARTAGFKIAQYTVTIGLTGNASESANGMNCTSGGVGTVCDEHDSAVYHVDLTYPYVLILDGTKKPPFRLPSMVSDSRHVVNGSFHMNGDYSPDGTTTTQFSCAGALSATAPDGIGSHALTWSKRGSTYSFVANTEAYGFAGTAAGSMPCNGGAWFGDGRLDYFSGKELSALVTLPASEIGRRTISKTVGGPASRYRESSACYQDRNGGSCEFTTAWHAVVKFTRVRIIGG